MADYGSLSEHADAFMAYLYGASDLTVYPEEGGGGTTVPAGAVPPYVMVQIVADRPLGDRLDMKSSRLRMRAYCQCVGVNDVAARAVSDLVADAVLDRVPDIAGRSCYPIRLDIGRDPLSSDTTGSTTVTVTDVYRLESEPGRDAS